ncbi:MAG: gamma-glutamyl-gamma-aminobutyrate hydrolase family protein [Vicinamibacterales bacterium]
MKPKILVPFPRPDYVSALEKAGAEVRTVDSSVSVDAAMSGVDGVLLTGGQDVDPALYGEERHPTTQDDEPGRDDLELAIAKRALAADLPMLAICRGIQVLNVAAGGSLVQDIPSEIGHLVPHDIREPRDKEAHSVRVKPGTRLAEALGSELNEHSETLVNSRHHQAIERVAPGLAVTAVAPDGLAEAVEKEDARFCVGVQWHPENFHASGRFKGLFEALVRSAERGAGS